MKGSRKIVFIPTYNEKDSIIGLLEQMVRLYPDLEIWVIDDNSPDGTGAIVTAFAKKHPQVRLVTRTEKNGLGEAYKHAIHMVQNQPDVFAVLTMDADGSHDPLKVGELFAALGTTADVAVGSRYVPGGAISGWDRRRLALSAGGNFYVRALTGFPIRDATAGFVAYKRSALDRINLSTISSAGYSFQIEMKNALVETDARFTEVPITFYERRLGVSKVSGNIIAEGLLIPWHIMLQKFRRFKARRYLALVLVLATVFFATYKLSESPSVWYDEGLYSQVAAHISAGETAGFQTSPDKIETISKLSVGYPLTYPVALFYKLFGTNVPAARSFMAITIIALVLAAYSLAMNSFAPGVALFSIALVSMFPPLYGNGKSVLGEVPGVLYLVLSYLCLQKVVRRVTISPDGAKPVTRVGLGLILSGLFLGLSAVTKPIFIVAAPASLLALIIAVRRGQVSLKGLWVWLVSAIVPGLVWIVTQFHAGDTIRDVIGFYSNPQPGHSLFSLIVSNLHHIVTEVGLLYVAVTMAVWIISIVVRMRMRRRIGTVEIGAFTFCLLICAAYLRTVGYNRYVFPAQIISLIYFPEALFYIFAPLRNRFKLSGLFQSTLIPIAVLLLFLAGVWQLMFHSWVADYYGSHKTQYWQEYFATHTLPNTLFYNVPEVAIFASQKDYSQYLNVAPDAHISIGDANIELLKQGRFDNVIMNQNDFETMKTDVQRHYKPVDTAYKYVVLTRSTPSLLTNGQNK
ncbi:MAG TPA: glycosyltransferase [Candidatus Paceibacterota bacterium]